MHWHSLEKEFFDYAADVEAVNIHYAWTPLGGVPDWEQQRVTRYMPLVQTEALRNFPSDLPSGGATVSALPKRRKKILKLPLHVADPETGLLVDHYLLHHYFEVFQGGHRRYSPVYTEEVVTGVGSHPLTLTGERVDNILSTDTMAGSLSTTGENG